MPARYYVTNVDPSWPAERQEEHLRDFSHATLWSMSMHEVYPGHFLQFEHLRGVASAPRKSVLFAPTSFVEGWAHYAEHVMIEQGFERKNTEIRLGQLSEALIRLARTIVGIRPAHGGPLRRAGRPLLPRRGLPGGEQRPAGSRARHLRPPATCSTRSASRCC